jgi:hypothetical protein
VLQYIFKKVLPVDKKLYESQNLGRPKVPVGSASPRTFPKWVHPWPLKLALGSAGPSPKPDPDRSIPIMTIHAWTSILPLIFGCSFVCENVCLPSHLIKMPSIEKNIYAIYVCYFVHSQIFSDPVGFLVRSCCFVNLFRSTIVIIRNSCCSCALVLWGFSTTTFHLPSTTIPTTTSFCRALVMVGRGWWHAFGSC